MVPCKRDKLEDDRTALAHSDGHAAAPSRMIASAIFEHDLPGKKTGSHFFGSCSNIGLPRPAPRPMGAGRGPATP